MAIAQVGSADLYTGLNSTTLTVSYNAVGGTDKGMIFFAFTNSGSGDVMTGVTFNGSSATKIGSWNTTGSQWFSAWRLTGYTTANSSAIFTTSVSTDAEGHLIEYTGVDQTNMSDVTPTQNTGTGNLTANITTTTDNSWLASVGRNSTYGPMGAGTGTTIRNVGAIFNSGDSNGAKTPTGSYSMQWTAAGGNSYSLLVVIKPATAAASQIKTWNGVTQANVKNFLGATNAQTKTWDGVTNV